MVAMTIYGLKELLMHVPEPTGEQAFVGLLRNLKVTSGSAGEGTDDDLLGRSEDEEDEIYLDASDHTMVPDTFSDLDEHFNPALPMENSNRPPLRRKWSSGKKLMMGNLK